MAVQALAPVDSGAESTDLEVYFTEADPCISQQAYEILVEYSGVPEDQLVSHVRTVVCSFAVCHVWGATDGVHTEGPSLGGVQISMRG